MELGAPGRLVLGLHLVLLTMRRELRYGLQLENLRETSFRLSAHLVSRRVQLLSLDVGILFASWVLLFTRLGELK